MTELLRYGSGDSGQHQEMNPVVQTGVTAFDPGASHFGMYSQWPTFPGRTVYSENGLNTFDSVLLCTNCTVGKLRRAAQSFPRRTFGVGHHAVDDDQTYGDRSAFLASCDRVDSASTN